MKTYVVVYEDNKYGTCSRKYEANDMFDAIDQFVNEGNDDDSIISITVGVY